MEKLQLEIVNKHKKNKGLKAIIILITSFTFLFLSFLPIRVIGDSMENTIKEGDKFIVNKLRYLFEEPKYKDVVLIKAYRNNKSYFIIKRIIGTPGDTILIKEDKLYINGEIVEEEYIKENINLVNEKMEIKLGEDEVFVMGDNRSYSRDSRKIGPIKLKRVVGKVIIK